MGGVSYRYARAARFVAAMGIFASALFLLFVPATAQTGASTAVFSNNGWWQKTPSAPPAPVPADAVAVAAEAGNPGKVAAFGMDVHVSTDETLVGLRLVLKESATPGAHFPPPPPPQAPSEQPPAQVQTVIVACPITSIYTPEDGGPIANAPVADCDVARGDGVRKADGTWEFDITSIAELWTSNALEQKGVLLVERVAAPVTFQVSYQDLSTGTPLLELETEPVLDDTTDTTEDTTPAVVEDTSSGSSGGDEGNFFTAIASGGSGTADTAFGIVETPPTTTPPAVATPIDETPPTQVVNRRPTKGTLPLATALLLPVALGLALVGGLVLGPAGDPATARTREGGLSRALARREEQGREEQDSQNGPASASPAPELEAL
jgi:hypothetical protein